MQTGYVATSTSASTGASSSTGSTTNPNSTLDENSFLNLLVAELQNQDPTQAQDPNAMVSQMAQFSALQQQTNTNSLLTSMQTQLSGLYQGQAASLLGKNVQVTSSAMNLTDGQGTIGLSLPAAASNVVVTLKNSSGQAVATLKEGAMAAGNQVVNWNGQDNNGNQLADGTYTVSVAATDASGNSLNVTTTSYATVTAVGFANGSPIVTAGGQQYPISAINGISS